MYPPTYSIYRDLVPSGHFRKSHQILFLLFDIIFFTTAEITEDVYFIFGSGIEFILNIHW